MSDRIESQVVCPRCDGHRSGVRLVNRGDAGCTTEQAACRVCRGRGVVDFTLARALAEREVMRQERIEQRVYLRDAAAAAGMTAVEYSMWERGDDLIEAHGTEA